MNDYIEEIASKVLSRLTLWHQGRERGISGARLAGALGVDGREIRKAVEELREEGSPICALPKYGYFYPVNQEEFEEFCEFLTKRSMKTLRLLSQMRRISLPALIGQMQLELTEEDDGPEDGLTQRREGAEGRGI